jgi:hypothetical protein
MADHAGVALPTPSIPEPTRSIFAPAHDFMVGRLADLRSQSEGFMKYELDLNWRNAVYLQRAESMWPAMAAEEEAEIDALLGRVTTPMDREAELEAFVMEKGEAEEEALLQFFQKRCLRQEALFEPVARELKDKRTQLIREA